MSEYRWIKDGGLVSEKDICSEALRKAPEKSLFLACGTNYFRAGHADGEELGTLKLDRLLELTAATPITSIGTETCGED